MIRAATETAITALNGTLRVLMRRNSPQPGIPRSRENAYQVREALVSPAAPQKSWPTVAMISTSFAPQMWFVIAVVKIEIELPPAVLIASVFTAAKRNASSTSQPAIAE